MVLVSFIKKFLLQRRALVIKAKTHYGLLCTLGLHMHICICTSAYGHPQTMNGLKTFLTEEGINFTDATFNTEDGIGGLGEQPFVSNMSTC